jgi:formylglycine-generating enzyme required for sulfatase activity
MKPIFALALALCCVTSAPGITIDTVLVGDAGNPNDPGTGNLYGGVNYAYNIGKYEVIVGQYTAFLNAVAAADDPNTLYNGNMAGDLNIAGIVRIGPLGSFTYSVIGSPNHPVTYVSWGDAARFANWMHNGQPTGAEGPGTTETGAYTLNVSVTHNADAKWFIPTVHEWYKAAYYQPAAAGGDSDGYWLYPTKTNSVPYSDQPPGATPDNTRVANFNNNDRVANGYNDGYAVTGLASYSSSQNYLTDVGAYASSPSFYGTFDQGGNVDEWNETGDGSERGVGGGSWFGSSVNLRPFPQGHNSTLFESEVVGFRLATGAVPEPSTILLAVTAFASLATRRRKSVPHNRV